MCNLRFLRASTVLASLILAGCGLSSPRISEIWDSDLPANTHGNPDIFPADAQIEWEIKKRVYCELRDAVHAIDRYPVADADTHKIIRYGLLPQNWGAQVTISLQVDESSALNPGATLNDVLENAAKKFGVQTVTVSQSYTFGFGGTLSSTATRIDKYNPYYSIYEMSKPYAKDSVCRGPQNDPLLQIDPHTAMSSPFLIESDLGIKEWLIGAANVDNMLPSDLNPTFAADSGSAGTPAEKKKKAKPQASGASQPDAGGKGQQNGKDTISYETKFVITSNGSVTPTWKLLRFSVNTGNLPLFSMGRVRTHDLIITIGPPTPDTSNLNFANVLSSSINNVNRAPGTN